jgi:hypothetical protein
VRQSDSSRVGKSFSKLTRCKMSFLARINHCSAQGEQIEFRYIMTTHLHVDVKFLYKIALNISCKRCEISGILEEVDRNK